MLVSLVLLCQLHGMMFAFPHCTGTLNSLKQPEHKDGNLLLMSLFSKTKLLLILFLLRNLLMCINSFGFVGLGFICGFELIFF